MMLTGIASRYPPHSCHSGMPECLADRIPDREVDAGQRDQTDPAVAELVVRDRVAELPAALVREGVLADQLRRDLVADHADDVRERLVLVGGIRLADDPLVG